jgi:hypothetical protein
VVLSGIQWRAAVNVEMNVAQTARNLLTNWATVSFTSWAMTALRMLLSDGQREKGCVCVS